MTNPRHALGLAAEAAVAAWLEATGWTLLARRVRSVHGGEVDILALDRDGVLVAVEVRARHSARTGAASLTLNRRRVTRLRHTLSACAAATRVPHHGLRVDLVSAEPLPAAPRRWRLRRVAGIDIG
jgi:putative endonuclease